MMDIIWLGISIFVLYILAKHEDKIGKNSHFFTFLLLINLLIIGIIVWDILGFDSGGGGSPYGDVDLYFNDS